MLSVISVNSFAMQSLEDEEMSLVLGQAGITASILPSDAGGQGKILDIEELRWTELDRDGGDVDTDFIAFKGISISNYLTNPDGTFLALDPIEFTFDVNADGDAYFRSSGFRGMHWIVENIELSGRTMGGMEITQFEMVTGSYLEIAYNNEVGGAEIGMNVKMLEGSSFKYKYTEDYELAIDVGFTGNGVDDFFYVETSLTADASAVKLEFGALTGGIELNNLNILENGVPFFAESFGDIGLSDVEFVSGSYMSIHANDSTATSEGLAGKFDLSGTIGNLFYRTNGSRINFKGINLSTNGEVDYTFDQFSHEYVSGNIITGIRATLNNIDDVTILLGGITFSEGVGDFINETVSAGSIGITNLDFNGDPLYVDLYTLPGSGKIGLLFDISAPGVTSFNLEITDTADQNGATPNNKLTAAVEMKNFAFQGAVDITPSGLNVGIKHMSADMSLNSLTAGNGARYQGSIGRMVLNSMSVRPGSYTTVSPF